VRGLAGAFMMALLQERAEAIEGFDYDRASTQLQRLPDETPEPVQPQA